MLSIVDACCLMSTFAFLKRFVIWISILFPNYHRPTLAQANKVRVKIYNIFNLVAPKLNSLEWKKKFNIPSPSPPPRTCNVTTLMSLGTLWSFASRPRILGTCPCPSRSLVIGQTANRLMILPKSGQLLSVTASYTLKRVERWFFFSLSSQRLQQTSCNVFHDSNFCILHQIWVAWGNVNSMSVLLARLCNSWWSDYETVGTEQSVYFKKDCYKKVQAKLCF